MVLYHLPREAAEIAASALADNLTQALPKSYTQQEMYTPDIKIMLPIFLRENNSVWLSVSLFVFLFLHPFDNLVMKITRCYK